MDPQRLLDQARAGDREAWNRLLKQLRPWVRALLRRALRQDADASDLAQEVQFRMDRGFPRFRGETLAQLRAWTRVIAANVLHDHRRAPPFPVVALPDAVAAPTPVPTVVDEEDMARLVEAVQHLPAHYQAVIEGRLLEGLSCVELAQKMGQLPGTVRTWCLRAVSQLNERLGARS
jgi:RNA polymerase sigma-70 factor (ECF subfamily)